MARSGKWKIISLFNPLEKSWVVVVVAGAAVAVVVIGQISPTSCYCGTEGALSAEVVAHLETSISIRRTRPFFGMKSNCIDWAGRVFVELLKKRFH